MTTKQKLSRTTARLAALALIVLGAATMSVTPAQAASTGLIIHDQSGLCLDGSVSQGIRLNKCSASNRYQQWTVDGYYLEHVQSGLCLDGSISQGVRLNTCHTSYQRWSTLDGYKLKHYQSGLYLDGSISQGVRLNTNTPTTYQEWALPN